MDPLTVTVVTALVAGSKAVMKGVASEAGKHTYTTLRDLIVSRFGAAKAAIEMVTSSPDSEAKRGVLAEDLEQTGASKDKDVVAAAQRLIDALEGMKSNPQAAALFDYGQLKVARDLQLRDIKSVGTVMRADIADIGRDMILEQVHQYEPTDEKKKTRHRD